MDKKAVACLHNRNGDLCFYSNSQLNGLYKGLKTIYEMTFANGATLSGDKLHQSTLIKCQPFYTCLRQLTLQIGF